MADRDSGGHCNATPLLVNQSVGPHAFVTLAADGSIRSWSPGARAIFGHEAGEVLGRHVSLLLRGGPIGPRPTSTTQSPGTRPSSTGGGRARTARVSPGHVP